MNHASSASQRVSGTQPRGTRTEAEAAQNIREMFSRIAPRYDFLNHLLSLRLDSSWRRRVAGLFGHILQRADARVLDTCCGTGDLALALAKAGSAHVFACDFARPMLSFASDKAAHSRQRLPLAEADSLQLPFADGSFDLVTTAFGFRNLANYDRGLAEIARVLKPGGELAILEFAMPRGRMFGPLYQFYFRRVLPRLGRAISRNTVAYSYLPESVGKFPSPEELAARMTAVGFRDVSFALWTGGSVALHTGTRS